MANIRHPNFILAIVAVLFHVVAIGMRANRHSEAGDVLTIIGAVLMFVSWVWSIFEVQKTNSLEGSQKKFWRIAVVAIPFVGGVFYHLLHSKPNTIVD